MTNTTASQVYVGAGSDKAIEAVRATYGRVLTWTSPPGEKMFCPYYSSTCGGETSPVNYLQPVQPIPPLAGGVHAPPAPTPSTMRGSRSTSAGRS